MLKFYQAEHWNQAKASAKLVNHFKWLSETSQHKVTSETIKLIQAGVIYIFGRDKHYRTTIINDIQKML